jgi:hypothetical protein
MSLIGFFQIEHQINRLGESIRLEMVLENTTDRKVYVFIPRGRAEGIQITMLQGPMATLRDLRDEAEPGLVAETEIGAGETHRKSYFLTDWLIVQRPGDYRVECACTLDAYGSSLRDRDIKRVAKSVKIKTEIKFTVL